MCAVQEVGLRSWPACAVAGPAGLDSRKASRALLRIYCACIRLTTRHELFVPMRKWLAIPSEFARLCTPTPDLINKSIKGKSSPSRY